MKTNVKNKHFTFINNGILFLLFVLLVIIFSVCFCITVMFWAEIPLLLKITGLAMEPIVLLAMVFMPFNGLYVCKSGTVVFIPDFRIIRCKVNDLERLSVTFVEWENGKYSAAVKLVYKNGKVFERDYSKQFRNMRKKEGTTSLYTIKKSKVDKYFDELKTLEKCNVTIIDIMKHITQQVNDDIS